MNKCNNTLYPRSSSSEVQDMQLDLTNFNHLVLNILKKLHLSLFLTITYKVNPQWKNHCFKLEIKESKS